MSAYLLSFIHVNIFFYIKTIVSLQECYMLNNGKDNKKNLVEKHQQKHIIKKVIRNILHQQSALI